MAYLKEQKKMTKPIFVLFLLLQITVVFDSVLAQEKRRVYEKYGVAEGLPEEYVRNILQDDKGFIWLTTQNGLVKYDGYDFKVYKEAKSETDSSTFLLRNSSNGLLQTREGKLWMGDLDTGRLICFDPSTEAGRSYEPQFSDSQELNTLFQRVFFEDVHNNIWYTNHSHDTLVLARFDPKTEIAKAYPYENTFGNALLGFQNLVYSAIDGNIWYIEPSGNLKVWTPEKDDFELVVAHGEKIQGIEIEDMLIALNTANDDNLLLIGKHGLYILNPVTQQIIQQYTNTDEGNHFLPDSEVHFAFTDLKGSYWAIHENNEITIIDPKSNSYSRLSYGLGSLNFQRGYKNVDLIVPSEQNEEGIGFSLVSNLLNGRHDPLHFIRYEFSTKSFIYYDSKFNDKNNPNRPTASLKGFTDNSGLSWLFYRPGFYKETPKTRQIELLKNDPKNPSSIPSDTIIQLFEDSKKRFWVGTRSGIARKKPNGGFQQIGAVKDASPISLNKFYEDSKGNLWAGSYGQGLYRYQETQQKFKKIDFIPDVDYKKDRVEVNAIQEDADGRIWVSVNQLGIYVLDGSSFEIKEKYEFANNEEHGLPSERIPILFLDLRGGIWLGDFDFNSFGLFKYLEKEKRFKHYAYDPKDSLSMSSNEIRFITEDDLGRIWVGTDVGLNRYDPLKDVFYRNTHINMPSTIAYAKAKNGKLWVSTYSGGGLALVGPEVNDVEVFGESEGLLHNDIQYYGELISDDLGQLWLPTARGLSVFDTNTKSFKSYFGKDGFQKTPERLLTGLKTHYGIIWLGSQEGNGLNRIDPKDFIKKDSTPPSVVITAMSVNDSSYGHPDGKIFKKSVAYTDKISLGHNQKNLGFEFVALHYLRSEDNLYSWKLENYDTEWTLPSKERKVNYTNLSPGNYTFRVKGSNADGIWNEEGASMEITILPPWWQTWWAYLGYALFFGGSIVALYRFQLHQKLKRAERLRLQEMDVLKTRLYTNITHEFRTPLTVILGMAEQVLEKPKTNLKSGIDMIKRNGENLLELVNQMLDLSKLESGKLHLTYQQGDVVSFIRYVTESFHSLAEDKGVQVHFQTAVESLPMDFDAVRLQQVVSNLISNAIKFTPGGAVTISTASKNGEFILKVADTGAGIAKADLPHIFDRFYQADGSHTRQGEGTGIGLSLTRELVKLFEGEIKVQSELGKGTSFEVSLPIRNTAAHEAPVIGDSFSSKNPSSKISNVTEETLETDMVEYLGDVTTHDGEKPVVLIADDNDDVRTYIASCLKGSYHIKMARNGLECEEMALQVVPDLIVLDVMMPYKDGFEVCNILKNEERTSHIPIILLTAKADMESKLEGLEQKADDYLTKPFHKKELLLRIKNLLELRQLLQQYYLSSLETGLPINPSKKKTMGSHQKASIPARELEAAEATINQDTIPFANNLDHVFVNKVKHTVEAYLDDTDFDVEKLCRELALSHSQVNRKLSALTGLSASYFIRYVRLLKAKQLLLHSAFKISAIANDCGFGDPAYFSRVFKKEFGITPQKWRDKNAK